MERVQQKDKIRADKARREVGCAEGDLVLLSTGHLKLKGDLGKQKPKFVGPFHVEALVGANAVRLDLPNSMSVHPVFNIFLLKHYQGDLVRPEPV